MRAFETVYEPVFDGRWFLETFRQLKNYNKKNVRGIGSYSIIACPERVEGLVFP